MLRGSITSARWASVNPTYITAGNLVDNVESSATTIPGAPSGGFRTNGQARVRLAVPIGTYSMVVYVGSNFIGEIGGGDPGVGVEIDGTYSTELVVTANGITPFVLNFDGLAHNVDLINGFQQNFSFSSVTGSFVVAYAGNGVTVRSAPATPSWIAAFYGDSITYGMLASPMARDSFIARSRVTFPGRMAIEAWGGRRLADDAGASGRTGLGSLDNLAARMVALAAAATTRDIILWIGVNDYGNGPWNASTFATNLASLATKIHALDSGARIRIPTLLVTNNEALAGFSSETPPQWRSAVVSACTGLTGVTVYDGLTFMTSGGLSGLHPTSTGDLAIYDGSGAFGSTSSIRTMLGF